MASADEAVPEELVAARDQIATLTFEARDMQAVNRKLHLRLQGLRAEAEERIWATRHRCRHQLDMYIEVLEADNEDLKADVEDLKAENKGLWHEVVGWAVQDCKRRRLK